LGEVLVDVGQLLHVTGNIIGPGRVDGSSKQGNGDDETVAVGALLQVGGELILGAVHLFASGQNYAGAALVRQLVEVEYLMWAFAENPKDAKKWLDSTPAERQRFFRPSCFDDGPADASSTRTTATTAKWGAIPSRAR
jgi:hypothetical protein